MTDKTEAQPEALRLDESKRYSDVVHHANVKASIAYVARKTGLGYQETERLLELALQRGDLTEGDYSGRKMEKIADDRLASLEAQLVAQTNRAAAAEQQVTALTQRLDMANRLGNDARAELAQLRQAGATADNHIPDAGRMVPHLAKTETCACCGEGVAYLSIIRVCDTCTSEYTGYNESKLLLAAASPTPPAQQKYRLLERGVDVIEPTDEFLQEDGVSWVTYSIGIVVGMTYRGSVLLPARRPLGIETAHGIGASNDSAT